MRGDEDLHYCSSRTPQPADQPQPVQVSHPSEPIQRAQSTLPTVLEEEIGVPEPLNRPGPTGAPQPQRTCIERCNAATSAAAIKAILKELDSRTQAFVYPKRLDFADPQLLGGLPELKDSPSNVPFIEYREKLLDLMGRLENVLIYEDEGVRLARLAAIDRVKSELSKVGRLKVRLWKKVSCYDGGRVEITSTHSIWST